MALFNKKDEGGLLDVIRCDEPEYLIWKWSPSGQALTTKKENSIRWGSSLRVKDGEVAVFVYKNQDGYSQDFIEGPFDETIKTANFPIISNIIGLAYAGQSPFQAEVYFINLAGNQKINFGSGEFGVTDPQFSYLPLLVSAFGTVIFRLTDYRAFIKLHRLIDFDLEKFKGLVKDSMNRVVRSVIAKSAVQLGIPAIQVPNHLDEVCNLVETNLSNVFKEKFGVELVRFDIGEIYIDRENENNLKLFSVTADIQSRIASAQAEVALTQADVNAQNIRDMQGINAQNLAESLAVQRDTARLSGQSQFLGAHQVNQQAYVAHEAASHLGEMGAQSVGGGSSAGGINPVGIMTGLAVGGALGGQMANMVNASGQSIQQPGMMPPPIPQAQYFVSINGQNTGPFGITQLQQMVYTMQLTKNSYVWKQGMSAWELAGNVPELASFFNQASPPPPPPPPPF